uniref:CRAL-TRIO domain-containing protein n=1 Tax=Steinernema glaseri TaxID=37863 RepID=A0A1I7YJ00_9BILA
MVAVPPGSASFGTPNNRHSSYLRPLPQPPRGSMSFAVDRDTSKITMTVKPNISPSDRQWIDKLRDTVKDDLTPYYDTDFNLLRWLKGHDYNLDVIVPKLRNHLTFRKSHWQLDSVASQPRDHPIHQHWKAGLTGLAGKTANVLVNIEQSGNNDYYGMLQSYSITDVLKARVHDLESMLAAVMEHEKKTGEQTSVMYIMDLNGLKFDRHTMGLLTGPLASISSFMSEHYHYVELIHSFVLVAAPSFISAIWTVAKPLLPEKTKNKVKIFGSDWREAVLNIAAPDSLPAYWNVPGEEERFHANVLRAVPFDPALYYRGKIDEKATLLNVSAGKTGIYKIQAEKGQRLSWSFSTDGHFGYGVYFSKDENESDRQKMTPVYPVFTKVPGPTTVPLHDAITCPATGTYMFWYTNEHAWLHTLKIHHIIRAESI